MLKSLYSKWRDHIYFWLFYTFYFYCVNYLGNNKMSVKASMLTVPYFAIVFYCVYGILHRFYKKRRIALTVILLTGFYILSGMLIYYVLYGQFAIKIINGAYVVQNYKFHWGQYIQSLLVIHGNFTILALLYYHYKGKLAELDEKLEAVHKQLEAETKMKSYEYATLSAQVAPHMMGNIFITWRDKLQYVDSELAQEVNETYKLMKFYMDAHQGEGLRSILLSDEVEALQRYLAIQHTVEKIPFYIDVELTGNLMRFTIPPTTLQTLVGNVFKHAEIADPAEPARIIIEVMDKGYRLQVSNRKRKGNAAGVSHGIGMRNLRRRMQYVYGDNFSMLEDNGGDYYQLHINVQFIND
ncbi:MAG: hypothetical protein K0R59_591 [Sphingobacterium sp.]|nr:hypothetical protein [Sphingobacterium sp.]